MRKILISLTIIALCTGCGATLSKVGKGIHTAVDLLHRLFDDAQMACKALPSDNRCNQILERMELVLAAYDVAIKETDNPERAGDLTEAAYESLSADKARVQAIAAQFTR